MRPPRPPRAIAFLHGGALRSPVLRSHELARHFAERLPVVYLPFRSPVELLLGDWRRAPWSPLARHPNVRFVPAPLTTFLARRSRAASAFHGRLGAAGIRRALKGLGIPPEETLFFVQSATATEVVERFPHSPVFYDCADDLAQWHGTSPAMRRLYTDLESRLARRAAWIAVTVPRLAERFSGSGAEVLHSSNGVDPAFFRAGPAAPELAHIPGPRLLFLGILSRFVDPEIIRALADSGLGSVVLVGPLDPRAPVGRLRDHPNVYWLGRREYEELPAYACGAQVGLIPGTDAPASDCVPAKLFMYSAAGLPVVGHDCSSLRPFADCIHLAAGPRQFVQRVREALAAPEWGREARLDLARRRQWSRIAAEILGRVGVP